MDYSGAIITPLMSLASGHKLGPYEIVSPLGAGGMGEVYRAHDTRLQRTVAIKILPSQFSSDAVRKQRFEREAKTISQLNHPHICTLYDVGTQDGIEYLVMECVEGETLAKRLEKGPLPVDQVVKFGAQIADALDNAHRHGVIHRDLKPANIIVTKTGVKLLDFGLAKMHAAEAAVGITAMTTQTTPLTGEGAILGTLQYMAPEQLEGAEADARTDIFALGAVIYEMATGHKAFAGKSQASLISAIMTSEPASISSIQRTSTPTLDHIVKTCLSKDPIERWQTARDVMIELRWLSETDPKIGTQPVSTQRRPLLRILLAALSFVAVFAAGVLLAGLREQRREMQIVRFQVEMPSKMDMDFYDSPVISPDGKRLILPGRASDGIRHLWLRELDSLKTQVLPGTEGAAEPFWSPDSHFIAFNDGNNLKRIDATGGPPVTLCSACDPGAGDWNRAGVIVFGGGRDRQTIALASPNATGSSRLLRVSAAGGEPEQVLPLDKSRQETEQLLPRFLPDGHHFLYLSRSTDARKSGIYVGSLDSAKDTRLLIATESNASFVSPGFLVYGRQQTLVAQPFDSRGLRLTGDPVPIAQHVRSDTVVPVSQFSASKNGVLVYSSPSVREVQLVWRNREGVRQGLIGVQGTPGIYSGARLSPDEKRLLSTRVNAEAGTSDLWMLEISTGILSRLTSHPSEDGQWSPDSKEIVFSSAEKGHLDLYRKAIGSGEDKLVFQSDEHKWTAQWLKDDSLLFVTTSGAVFYRLALSGEKKPVAVFNTKFENNAPVVSSDGQWVAYQSVESGRWEVYVAAFPSFHGRRQVSNTGGCQPHWRKDGKELFYLSMDGNVMSVEMKPGDTSAPRTLFQSSLLVDPYSNVWEVTGDGKKFIIGEPIGESGKPVNVVLNWSEGLKK